MRRHFSRFGVDFVFTRRTTRTRLSSIESQPKKVVAVVVPGLVDIIFVVVELGL